MRSDAVVGLDIWDGVAWTVPAPPSVARHTILQVGLPSLVKWLAVDQDTGSGSGYWRWIRILAVDQDTGSGSGYWRWIRILWRWIRILMVDQDTGGGSGYKWWIRIQAVDRDTSSGSEYKRWIWKQSVDQTKVYKLRRSICKLKAKKTMAHDDVTQRTTAQKILKKINGLATRIELTLSILMTLPCNLLRNNYSTIHFHICSFSLTYVFAQGHSFDAVTVTRCDLLMVLCLYRMCQCGYSRSFCRTSVQFYAPYRCRNSHYRRTFISLSVSLWNDLDNPVFDGVLIQ